MALMLLKNPCFSFSCFHKNPCFLLQKNCLSLPFPHSTPPLGGQKVPPPLEPFLGIQQFLRHSPPPLEKSRRPCVDASFNFTQTLRGSLSTNFLFPLSSAEGSREMRSSRKRNKYSASREKRVLQTCDASLPACFVVCRQTRPLNPHKR